MVHPEPGLEFAIGCALCGQGIDKVDVPVGDEGNNINLIREAGRYPGPGRMRGRRNGPIHPN